MERIRDEAAESLKIYDGFDEVEFPEMQCEGYSFHETLEDIDNVIIRKWKETSAEEASQF